MVKNHPHHNDGVLIEQVNFHQPLFGLRTHTTILIILCTLLGFFYCLLFVHVSPQQSFANPHDLVALRSELANTFLGCTESNAHSTRCLSALEDLDHGRGPKTTKLERVLGELRGYRNTTSSNSSNYETVVKCIREAAESDTSQSGADAAAGSTVPKGPVEFSDTTNAINTIVGTMHTNQREVLSQIRQLS